MATKQQIPKIAAALVEFQDSFMELPTEDGQWLIKNTREAIAIFIKAVANRKAAECLPKVIEILAREEDFQAEEFKVDKEVDARVRISIINDEFKSLFKNHRESARPAQELRYFDLDKDMIDEEIIATLTKHDGNYSVTLFDLYYLLLLQPDSPRGHLLSGPRQNIFYIKNAKNRIVPVYVSLRHEGWIIVASENYARNRMAGDRVFYRPD